MRRTDSDFEERIDFLSTETTDFLMFTFPICERWVFLLSRVYIASFCRCFILTKFKQIKIITNSLSKTKVITFSGPNGIRIKFVIQESPIEQVSDFKYLGCSITPKMISITLNMIKMLKAKSLPVALWMHY